MSTRRISRRLVLGSVGAASLCPALHTEAGISAAATSGTPAGPALAAAFIANLEIGPLVGAAPGNSWAAVHGGCLQARGWQATVTAGRVECWRDAQGVAQIDCQFWARTATGAEVRIHQRALRRGPAQGSMQMNLQCELAAAAEDALLRPALLVGTLDAAGLTGGTLKSVVFEVI